MFLYANDAWKTGCNKQTHCKNVPDKHEDTEECVLNRIEQRMSGGTNAEHERADVEEDSRDLIHEEDSTSVVQEGGNRVSKNGVREGAVNHEGDIALVEGHHEIINEIATGNRNDVIVERLIGICTFESDCSVSGVKESNNGTSGGDNGMNESDSLDHKFQTDFMIIVGVRAFFTLELIAVLRDLDRILDHIGVVLVDITGNEVDSHPRSKGHQVVVTMLHKGSDIGGQVGRPVDLR